MLEPVITNKRLIKLYHALTKIYPKVKATNIGNIQDNLKVSFTKDFSVTFTVAEADSRVFFSPIIDKVDADTGMLNNWVGGYVLYLDTLEFKLSEKFKNGDFVKEATKEEMDMLEKLADEIRELLKSNALKMITDE